jgi:hypothetical protein
LWLWKGRIIIENYAQRALHSKALPARERTWTRALPYLGWWKDIFPIPIASCCIPKDVCKGNVRIYTSGEMLLSTTAKRNRFTKSLESNCKIIKYFP